MADEPTEREPPVDPAQEERRQLFRGIAMPGLNFGALGGALFPRFRRGKVEPDLPEDDAEE